MKTMYVKLNDVKDIYQLGVQAGSVSGDVTVRKGIYVVDGKSLMGVFSLSLREGVTVEYPETAVEFENYIKNFKAD